MSHIVTIGMQVKDAVAVSAACRRLHLPQPTQGTHRLYSDAVTGLGVQLPGWKYPVVVQLEIGELRYDNYGGHWGEQQHLDRFVQAYAAEKVKAEARRKGHVVSEQSLADGSLKLTVNVGGSV